MIAIMLMSALPATYASRAPTKEEIVVTGHRMRQVRVETRVDSRTGVVNCWITKSSGDTTIDWQMCEITKSCASLGPANKKLVQQCLLAKDEAFLKSYVPPAEGTSHASH